MVKICVVGSISTDFIISTKRRPEVGETIEGKSFTTQFGGKGSNQAVVCSRLGAETHMVGAVGDDEFGPKLLKNLKSQSVSIEGVKRVDLVNSGSAFITLADQDNSIVYIPGANNCLNPEDIETAEKCMKGSNLVLVQNEVPLKTVEKLIDYCHKMNVPILLNPAPVRNLKEESIKKVAFITPNENEFEALFPNKEMEDVLSLYPNKLLVTLGSNGVKFHDGSKVVHVPSYNPKSVKDTTGAGDTFNGAFAVAYTSGLSITESIKFGCLAAAISIEEIGAQKGAPTLKQMIVRDEYEETWHFK